MDCKRAREAISERMDGERQSDRDRRQLDEHLETCARCSGFAAASWRLRESVRFEVAAAVPDLVGPIMTRVGEEPRAPARPVAPAPAPAGQRASGPRLRRPGSGAWRALAPLVAALVVGAAAGSYLVGGPRTTPPTIAAAEITHGVASAARGLNDYSARFAVREYHFRPEIPVREFSLDVSFAAPGRFRMHVADRTDYPGRSWTPNDLTLIVNGSRSFSSGPAPCPSGTPPLCPQVRAVSSDRTPFETSPQLPTDLVLPIGTLDDPAAVNVLGRGRVAGRSAYQVELPFARAAALFPFLHAGGAWRPFFAQDRVVLWVDAHNYFPLEYRVFPSADPARRAWERQNGLPREHPHFAIFQTTVVEVDTGPAPPGNFVIPNGHRVRSATAPAEPVSLAQAQRIAGYPMVAPSNISELHPYGAVVSPTLGGRAAQTTIAYTSGLAWLKVQETTGWDGDAPFGRVGPQAAQVRLAGGGVGYYEPATQDAGRRLAIHGSGYDLYLETDLPSSELLAVAGSLPLRGRPFPSSWLVGTSAAGQTARVPLVRAIASRPFAVDLPTNLPPGYALASAELVHVPPSTGLNVYFQQRESGLGSGRILLHEEAAAELPPASAASQSTIAVAGSIGRWTPGRGELEWVTGGVYHALQAPGISLRELIGLADSFEPAPATNGSGVP